MGHSYKFLQATAAAIALLAAGPTVAQSHDQHVATEAPPAGTQPGRPMPMPMGTANNEGMMMQHMAQMQQMMQMMQQMHTEMQAMHEQMTQMQQQIKQHR
jgi:hypothetical protein